MNTSLKIDKEWLVKNEIDLSPPQWKAKPKKLEFVTNFSGCVHFLYQEYQCDISDSSELIAKVKTRNLETEVNRSIYVFIWKCILQIGVLCCFNYFGFQYSQVIECSIVLMDSSGNLTKWEG